MTTSEMAAALGRIGGRSTSPAKVAAVRINLERARRRRWERPRMVGAEAVRRAVKNAEHHARTETT
jgi:aspartyl/asparaginyl beta-hydroxylase (cupin superfamily)